LGASSLQKFKFHYEQDTPPSRARPRRYCQCQPQVCTLKRKGRVSQGKLHQMPAGWLFTTPFNYPNYKTFIIHALTNKIRFPQARPWNKTCFQQARPSNNKQDHQTTGKTIE